MILGKTSIQKLALHLSGFSLILIENNPSERIRLKTFKFIDTSNELFDKNIIYVITLSDLNDLYILKNEANFVILTKFEREIQSHLGPDSNAIVLPESTNSIALSNYIQGFFCASASFNEFGALLLSELEHQNKLSNYLNLLSNYIDHPVAVYDSSFHVISHSTNEDVSDPVWDMLLKKQNSGILEETRRYMEEDLPDILPRMDYPLFYEKPSLPKRILSGLKVNNTNSYMLEILENGKPLHNSDLAFAFFTASFLQYYMASQYHNFRQDNINILIEDIISGKETDTFRMYNRAEALNLMLDSENYMLLIYTDKNIGFRQLLHSVHELRQLSMSTTILLGSEILMLISGKSYQELLDKKIVPYIKAQKCFKCSISARFNGISTLKNAYEQCCAAKSLGAIMDVNGTWFDYEAYREFHFANKYLSDEDVDFFCTPVAKEIVQHDRMHKTRYAYTLMLYIKNFKNAATVARIMHTHRNTMFYRLEKIADQFDLNYDNPIQMNNLSLSFNILASRYPDIFS